MIFLYDKLEGEVQSSVIPSSFLLPWECWMLHRSVLHPFNAKKTKPRGQPFTSCVFADSVRLKLTSGTVFLFFLFCICIFKFTYLGITFNFLPRCSSISCNVNCITTISSVTSICVFLPSVGFFFFLLYRPWHRNCVHLVSSIIGGVSPPCSWKPNMYS